MMSLGGLGVAGTSTAGAQVSVVAWTSSYCDYFIVSTLGGYAALEWYGGAYPRRGMRLYGLRNRYGFQGLGSGALRMRVWVEDYWLSGREAVQIVRNNGC